ncbi:MULTISPECIES: hypothetical protein [unclassified Psychrobacter]|jgi:hypothetical protein|uniref:hypothetical protein n=1 Tax=Psychrobacter TaxID=497 RepID=UPI0003FD1EE3|nr:MULTISPECIES: hypothetical protein [unclassified Psychrobacter]MCG3881271.1 hypothetical protein [Psychrobacter sp. Ps3]|tara:strand:+ start:313 stop:465 length:153 start_codon:yes stop_codon:yes gene_type:complete
MNLGKEQSDNSAKINQIMQDNPDLSYEFIRQLLIAQTEIEIGQVTPFKFG